MIGQFQHFSDLLGHEYKKRQVTNPRYSMRAFSRDLEISSASLSLILRKQSGLSQPKAKLIARKLKLNEQESGYFCTLVQANTAKLPLLRTAARLRLRQFETRYNSLSEDAFQAISQWYHFAVMELVRIHGSDAKPEKISKKLGITTKEAKASIDRLFRLGILKIENERMIVASDCIILPDGPADNAARSFHRQLLTKALSALDQQSVEERNIASVVLRVKEKDLKKASQMLKEFRRKFCAEMESGEGHDRVYALSMPFFRLDQEEA